MCIRDRVWVGGVDRQALEGGAGAGARAHACRDIMLMIGVTRETRELRAVVVVADFGCMGMGMGMGAGCALLREYGQARVNWVRAGSG